MRPERRAVVVTGWQAKQRRNQKPHCGSGQRSIVADSGEAKAETHCRDGDLSEIEVDRR